MSARFRLGLIGIGVATLLVIAPMRAHQPDDTPIGSKWWPSEWGAADERGALNRQNNESVVSAAHSIREGRIFQLGRLYEHGMPLPGKRHFSLTIPGSPTGGPLGSNGLVHHDELISGELGQVGTQLDGLGHVGVRIGTEDLFYNGFKRSEFGTPYGLERLGVEKSGVFFSRGVLIDMPAALGIDRLQSGQVISAADLVSALKKQNVDVRAGDAVLIRTGHGSLWMKDNAAYADGEPGIGMEAAHWLAERKIVLVGSDTWATEVVPFEDPQRVHEVHQLLLVRHGIYNLENLDLDELAAARAYEFAFIFAPLKLKGATGSPGNPIAVR